MFAENPFQHLSQLVPDAALQAYVIVMALAVVVGTLLDAWHKGSAHYFSERRALARRLAKRDVDFGRAAGLAVRTVAEAAVSGEFCKWPRRLSHLLMMYGFLLYVISTLVLVFAGGGATAALVWHVGAAMIVVGGLWFFFFLRVNVAFDGDSPFHVGRADLFVLSLIASALFAWIWSAVQAALGVNFASVALFGVWIAATTVLFGTVFWSKFAHMFYKPVVAYQRRVEDASGATDLPTPNIARHCSN